ncbi:malonate decarboxylase acyl carrier protein [Trinickia sp. LjRoot230]|uniref:malonate decarboxylase acyl carrier protein n=1 Tax=Trinickia sp. LjRoot230 TaxID=3342288 RepID=UPI003ED0775D
METLTFTHASTRRLPGFKAQAIVGVVGSGNLEVLAERIDDDAVCEIEICSPVKGFAALWHAVTTDFVERHAPGGVRFSINDCGARPDTVMLRLMQAAAALGDDV